MQKALSRSLSLMFTGSRAVFESLELVRHNVTGLTAHFAISCLARPSTWSDDEICYFGMLARMTITAQHFNVVWVFSEFWKILPRLYVMTLKVVYTAAHLTFANLFDSVSDSGSRDTISERDSALPTRMILAAHIAAADNRPTFSRTIQCCFVSIGSHLKIFSAQFTHLIDKILLSLGPSDPLTDPGAVHATRICSHPTGSKFKFFSTQNAYSGNPF